MAAIQRDSCELITLSRSDIAQATARGASMSPLLQLVERYFHDRDSSDAAIAPFWAIRDSLYAQEGVILYDDRVIIPPSLRQNILRHLHAAHQGTSAIEQRARDCLLAWNDEQHERSCTSRYAPIAIAPTVDTIRGRLR